MLVYFQQGFAFSNAKNKPPASSNILTVPICVTSFVVALNDSIVVAGPARSRGYSAKWTDGSNQ
jgi:hypothetical protein